MMELEWIAVIGLSVLIFGGIFWTAITAGVWWRLRV
jgi:hypothetical protein